jgi:hypothetical protein
MKRIFTLLLLLASLSGGISGRAGEEKADKVVVYKSKRQMQLLQAGKVPRTYRIALGDSPVGHKRQEGDEKTPEGAYVLDWRNPKSIYYKSIHISYPNARDREQARRRGVSPGGDIMVHGRNGPVYSPTAPGSGRTGPTAALPLPTPKWTKSGAWSATARPSRSIREYY